MVNYLFLIYLFALIEINHSNIHNYSIQNYLTFDPLYTNLKTPTSTVVHFGASSTSLMHFPSTLSLPPTAGHQDESSGLSTHRLALTMLIKIVKSLGCAYGCGEGHRGLSGDRLRMQVTLPSPPSLSLPPP